MPTTNASIARGDIDRASARAMRCMHRILYALETRHALDLRGHCGRQFCARARCCRRPGRCALMPWLAEALTLRRAARIITLSSPGSFRRSRSERH
jgi:hypothetical protein